MTLNGKQVGTIFFHARQEHKVVGSLTVTFNKALIYNRFANPNQNVTLSLIFGGKTEPFFTTQPVSCYDQTDASSHMSSTRSIPTFSWENQTTTLNITNRNNAHDLFVEVRQGDLLIGQVQFSLWDAFLDNMPELHYIETRTREIAGELYLTTSFDGQEDNDKPKTHHRWRIEFRKGFVGAVAGLFPFLKSKHAAASQSEQGLSKSHANTSIDSKQGTGGTTGPLKPVSTQVTTGVTAGESSCPGVTQDPIDPTSITTSSSHPQATHVPNADIAQNASIATQDLSTSSSSTDKASTISPPAPPPPTTTAPTASKPITSS